MDWEAELGVVIGAEVRHATPQEAEAAIAGYTVVNDVTARDFQYRSVQWLQGKTFERSTPVGPWLVVDEGRPGEISCEVDGDVVQKADTADLVFSPAAPGRLHLPADHPGARRHHRHRHPGRRRPRPQTPALPDRRARRLVTRIEGLGEQRNILVTGGTGA